MSYSEYEFFGYGTAPQEVQPQSRSFHATCCEDGCIREIKPGCGSQCRECYERDEARRNRAVALFQRFDLLCVDRGIMHF